MIFLVSAKEWSVRIYTLESLKFAYVYCIFFSQYLNKPKVENCKRKFEKENWTLNMKILLIYIYLHCTCTCIHDRNSIARKSFIYLVWNIAMNIEILFWLQKVTTNTDPWKGQTLHKSIYRYMYTALKVKQFHRSMATWFMYRNNLRFSLIHTIKND